MRAKVSLRFWWAGFAEMRGRGFIKLFSRRRGVRRMFGRRAPDMEDLSPVFICETSGPTLVVSGRGRLWRGRGHQGAPALLETSARDLLDARAVIHWLRHVDPAGRIHGGRRGSDSSREPAGNTAARAGAVASGDITRDLRRIGLYSVPDSSSSLLRHIRASVAHSSTRLAFCSPPRTRSHGEADTLLAVASRKSLRRLSLRRPTTLARTRVGSTGVWKWTS